MTADLVYLVAGGSLLLAIVLPAMLERWAVSAPMVLVAVGIVLGLTPLPDGMPLDPQTNPQGIDASHGIEISGGFTSDSAQAVADELNAG